MRLSWEEKELVKQLKKKIREARGEPFVPAPPYPGRGPIARRALQKVSQKPDDADERTKKSQVYWAAYRIAQKEKIELMGYTPPGWLGARKKVPKRRQWLPGEHKPPAKSTTAKGTNTSGQDDLL